MEYSVARRSLGLCARELDYFAPFLGIVSDELAEVAGSTMPPRSANRAFNLGSASPALISLLSLLMISDAVFFGALRPTHWLASKPGTKSPTVGISGSASERIAVVTAKARSLPALMYSIDAAMSVNVTWICPPADR